MEMFVCCLLFAVGVVLVIKGGDAFVDAASWIDRAMDIPTFIIGATIVSLATTMPEMIVSVMAAAQGKVDMAVGNAVGSVIANTGLIMAVAMMAMAIPCSREKYLRQCLLLTVTAAVLVLGCRGGKLGIGWSAVLIVLFAYFYSSITFNPSDIAKNVQQNGGTIPGIRQGKPTVDYLARTSHRLILFEGIFLALLATIPTMISIWGGINLPFAASSLLIAVSVSLETMKQIESEMLMRHYKGFL